MGETSSVIVSLQLKSFKVTFYEIKKQQQTAVMFASNKQNLNFEHQLSQHWSRN